MELATYFGTLSKSDLKPIEQDDFDYDDSPDYVPASIYELEDLLDRLEQYDIGSQYQYMAKGHISTLFKDLSKLYSQNVADADEKSWGDE